MPLGDLTYADVKFCWVWMLLDIYIFLIIGLFSSLRHMKNTVNVVTCGAQKVPVRNSCSLFNVPAGLLVSSPTSFLLPPLQH